MALINSLSGITEISDNLYEVTSLVSIGSGIDDVADSTFIMKDGGLLKWTSGCTTTFTNCVFHETDTALALGVDNFRSYQSGYPPRFNGTCAPVFKGCNFVCNTSTRSDFDADVNAGMTFTYDEEGSPCRIIVRNDSFAQYNHLASDKQIINGLVIDQDGAGAALEFAAIPSDPTQWSNLKVVNYDGTSSARHVTMLFYGTSGNEYTISNLECRNLALYGGTGTLRAVDPIGRLLKTNDTTSSDDGRLEVYRTYSSTFIDAVTGTGKTGRAVYYTSNGLFSDELGATYTSELLQYSQASNTVTVVTEPDYTEVLQVYGYLPQTRTFTLQDETDPEANIKNVFVFEDTNITETDEIVVRDYTEISDANRLYDASRYFVTNSYDTGILGYNILTAVGSTLNLSDHNLIVDPNFDFAFGYTGGSGSIAVTGTATETPYVSGVRLYEEDTDKANVFDEADFDAVVAAPNAYQLNNFQFNDDGTKVFAFGTSSSSDACNVIIEYTLSTAYDLNTGTQTATLSTGFINGQHGFGRIVNNGTKVIWSKRWGNWYEWTLSTAWDLSTASSITTIPMVARRTGFDFNADGTKLYTSRDGADTAGTYVYEYTLSTPYDVSSRGAETEVNLALGSFNTHSSFNTQRSIKWLEGGNLFYFNDPATNQFHLLKASTAYSTASATLLQTLDTGFAGGTDVSCGVESVPKEDKIFFSSSLFSTGYEVKTFDMYQATDFNGANETIYIKANTLAGTDLFNRIETTGLVTFQNGASTDMVVQDANGVSLNVTVSNVVAGSRVQVYNVTKDTELANEISAGTTYNYGYLGGIVGAEIDSGDQIRTRIAKATGTEAYDWFEATAFATSDGVFTTASQVVLDAYALLNVDASTVTEFILDIPNIEVDLNDPDGLSQKKRLVAWLYYIVANDADGMRHFFNVVDLQDGGNAKLNVDIADVKVDNIGTKQVNFTDTDFYLYRSDGASWVQYPSTGNYGITSDSGKIYVAVVNESGGNGAGGSGSTDCPTASEIAIAVNNTLDIPTAVEVRQEIDNNSTQLASIRTTAEAIPTDNSVDLTGVTDGLDVINRGVKKASLFVPHDEDI